MMDWTPADDTELAACRELTDRADWGVAEFAFRMREQHKAGWAERVGAVYDRKPRTVMGWARAFHLRQMLDLPAAVLALPFSCWEAWGRYVGRDGVDPEELTDCLVDFAALPDGERTLEDLREHLADRFGNESVSANGAHPLLRWPTTVAPTPGNFIVELDGESWKDVREVKIKAVKA